MKLDTCITGRYDQTSLLARTFSSPRATLSCSSLTLSLGSFGVANRPKCSLLAEPWYAHQQSAVGPAVDSDTIGMIGLRKTKGRRDFALVRRLDEACYLSTTVYGGELGTG